MTIFMARMTDGMQGLIQVCDHLVAAVHSPSTYWVKSLVPMVKKSTISASCWALMAADRRFHHDADGEVLVKRLALGPQLGLALVDDGLHLGRSPQRRSPWGTSHEVCRNALARSTSAHLRLDDIQPVKIHTDCAPSQEGVHLLGELDAVGCLVTADIQRADDHSACRPCLQRSRFVGFKLLLLGGEHRDGSYTGTRCGTNRQPSAPFSSAPLTSLGEAMLATTSTWCPSSGLRRACNFASYPAPASAP